MTLIPESAISLMICEYNEYAPLFMYDQGPTDIFQLLFFASREIQQVVGVF